MAEQAASSGDVVQGRIRERESSFPMIPVDEAIGHVLAQATPSKAATMRLSEIPSGTEIRLTTSCSMTFYYVAHTSERYTVCFGFLPHLLEHVAWRGGAPEILDSFCAVQSACCRVPFKGDGCEGSITRADFRVSSAARAGSCGDGLFTVDKTVECVVCRRVLSPRILIQSSVMHKSG